MNDVLCRRKKRQRKNTLDICAAFPKAEPRSLSEPRWSQMCCAFGFPVRHVWQDADRTNRPVWLLGAVGLHAEVEVALPAVRQGPLRVHQWHGAAARYLLSDGSLRAEVSTISCSPLEGSNSTQTQLRLILLPVCLVVLSPGPDGLQPQPPVLWVAGPALHGARPTSRNPAGPLHPGVHAAAVHDAGLPGEGHVHGGQRPSQLRGLHGRSRHQAHVSRHCRSADSRFTPRSRCALQFPRAWNCEQAAIYEISFIMTRCLAVSLLNCRFSRLGLCMHAIFTWTVKTTEYFEHLPVNLFSVYLKLFTL